ncbi:hypothetical protein [Helicobacter sp. T3_23-1056]
MKNTRTNTQGVKQVALSNSAKTRERERERERESNSALKLSSFQTANHQTYKETSVITDNDSASVIVSKDSTSVIASETLVKRGNLQCNTANIDCHENPSGFSRNDDGRVDCHEFANADSRNDNKNSPSLCGGGLRGWVSYPNTHKRTIQNPNPCHTEGVARSISKSKNVSRDISRSRTQYNNKRDASFSTKSQYDGNHSVITDNDSTSVIASERSERGNPQRRISKVDCHALDSAKMQNLIARNDDNVTFNDKVANSRNDSIVKSHSYRKTHPQAPSAREGAYFGLPRATSCARNDGVISPSLAEGARGWVSCHTKQSEVSQNVQINRDISRSRAQYDNKRDVSVSVKSHYDSKHSVIASERSERGNPQCRISKVDCHANASAFARNDGNAKSFNDKIANFASAKSTHPQTPSAREGAFNSLSKSSLRANAVSVAIHEKNPTENIDCHEFASANSRNDGIVSPSIADLHTSCPPSLAEGARGWVSLDSTADIIDKIDCHDSTLRAESRNDKKKRLALSLATSAFVAGLATIDSAVASCVESGGNVICSGNMNATDVSSYITSHAGRNVLLGTQDSPLNVSGDLTLNRQGAILRTQNSLNVGKLTLQNFNGVHIGNSSRIDTLEVSGTIDGVNMTPGDNWYSLKIGGGTLISGSITGNGTIGGLAIGDRGVINSGFYTDFTNFADVGTANGKTGPKIAAGKYIGILSGSITVDDSGGDWNGGSTVGQHIIGNDNLTISVADGSIVINAGDSIDPDKIYKYSSVVTKAKGLNDTSKCFKNEYTQGCVGLRHLVAGTGIKLKQGRKADGSPDYNGFMIEADLATSYGANMFRALTLGSLRRTIMTQNVLDTMTTKTFHSDRYYNQEVELRLLQYDMSRMTNRSSKFAKNTRKNQKQIDKTREKIAKLTLEQSKGQNLDKGYNNFEVIDQLDAIFIPYTGRRDWRFFALPYATHSYVDFGLSDSQEYAGGALAGLQRNLRANGIFGGFVGYEFINTDTMLKGNIPTRVQTNSLQAGLNYFQTFSITKKVMEGFIKASIRGGIDLPNFTIQEGGFTMRLESNDKSAIPLVYNVGAEVKGGVTFYQFKRNSYVSPEVSLSYDMLGSNNTKIKKPNVLMGSNTYYRPLGADETYDAFIWHLPQIGVHVRYYKMYGNKFRTNFKAGVKYNMLNKQETTFRIAKNLIDKGTITLPSVYGNLGLDLIWMIKKNHELSFGYDGLFYASSFAKERDATGKNVATSDWFNGVTTNLNFKYAYWFGGSDYVTDKDGNAVARSIAEGGKKSKKSKKSKKKKEKKSKKKVYYIDG